MAKAIEVGVITNAAGAHRDIYFGTLARIEEVGRVSLADPSGQVGKQAAKALGEKLGRTYQSAGDMLRAAQPQMVLVSVEAALAPPLIDAALDAGCHVLAEKPACVRAEDFEPLVRKAERKHRFLMLALANRTAPSVREARRRVHEGKLGKIYGVEVHIIADQTRLKSEAYRKAWFCSKERAGGGHLVWLGIHWLDLALYITGLKVRRVAGFAAVVGGQRIDVEDSAAAALQFDNGSLGTMTSGYYLDKGYQEHVQVWGEHGWLKLREVNDEPVEFYSTKCVAKPGVEVLTFPKGERGYLPFVRSAVRACMGLEPPPITGEEGLHVLRAIFAFYKAAQAGRTEPVA